MASGKKQGKYLGTDDNALHGKGGHVERLAKRVVQLESQLAAAQRERDELREALGNLLVVVQWRTSPVDESPVDDCRLIRDDIAQAQQALARQQGAEGERVDLEAEHDFRCPRCGGEHYNAALNDGLTRCISNTDGTTRSRWGEIPPVRPGDTPCGWVGVWDQQANTYTEREGGDADA